ncbi:MAG: tRNA (adenosine(37)-N6)-dimethylallyltransferase MiaA [Deltaproteobacteria bacterium]|nr:tRNA (adenosine(37)-N6)-dimethylallyltransferase MiaA [Deltaproteobacteria bacterium]
MKPKLVIILGPTGVGKSEVALDVAEEVDGEIINADSQQIYRSMDIGTAKPPAAIRRRVTHHLIDIVDPDEDFNAARFREMALKSAEEIRARRKRVVLCGGTGLYIRAFTHGLFIGPASDPAIRKRLEAEIEAHSLNALYERLRDVDPEAIAWIHPHDRQRIIRALEVFELTGKRMSDWQREHGFRESLFATLKIGLDRERTELYDLINRRCDEMMAKGLVDEVKALVGKGYSLDLRPFQSVGYRHIGLYLKRELSLEDAVSLMKRDSRRLAKRQLTWFRADKETLWFHPEKDRRKIIETAKEFFMNEQRKV